MAQRFSEELSDFSSIPKVKTSWFLYFMGSALT